MKQFVPKFAVAFLFLTIKSCQTPNQPYSDAELSSENVYNTLVVDQKSGVFQSAFPKDKLVHLEQLSKSVTEKQKLQLKEKVSTLFGGMESGLRIQIATAQEVEFSFERAGKANCKEVASATVLRVGENIVIDNCLFLAILLVDSDMNRLESLNLAKLEIQKHLSL